jgi:hypothetical protein
MRRQEAFALTRKSEAKTVRGQVRALLKFYKKNRWARGTLWRRNGPDHAFCLQGAMISLGFLEDPGPGHDSVAITDALSQCIMDSAADLGYGGYVSIPALNDNLGNKKQMIRILNYAAKAC